MRAGEGPRCARKRAALLSSPAHTGARTPVSVRSNSSLQLATRRPAVFQMVPRPAVCLNLAKSKSVQQSKLTYGLEEAQDRELSLTLLSSPGHRPPIPRPSRTRGRPLCLPIHWPPILSLPPHPGTPPSVSPHSGPQPQPGLGPPNLPLDEVSPQSPAY